MKERLQFNLAERWKLRFQRSQSLNRKRKRGIFIAVAGSILALVTMALPWIWEYKLNYEQGKVELVIRSYSEVAATLAEVDRLNAEIAKKNLFLQVVDGRAKNPRLLMAQITKLLPEGSKITSFSLQADYSLQLAVTLLGPVDTAKLWISFRDSGMFTEVDLNSVLLADQVHNLSLVLKLK